MYSAKCVFRTPTLYNGQLEMKVLKNISYGNSCKTSCYGFPFSPVVVEEAANGDDSTGQRKFQVPSAIYTAKWSLTKYESNNPIRDELWIYLHRCINPI